MAAPKPPPNYLARSFQLKMLSLIGALVLVWVLMAVAKDPKNWEWFFRIGRGSLGTKHVDTRYRPAPVDARGPVIRGSAESGSARAITLEQDMSLDERAWARVVEDLDDTARSRLLVVLRDVPRGQPCPFTAEERQQLLSDLDRAWSAISASDLIPPGSAVAPAVDLVALWDRWRGVLEPAIMGKPASDDGRESLVQLRTLLGHVGCRLIRHNTSFRSRERFAWQWFLTRLQASNNAELAGESVGQVAFLQLFDQPQVYQCKVVTTEGFIRRFERVPSRESGLGIRQLYRLWVKPADGSDAPFVVYCLELPRGLPKPTVQQPAIDRDIPGDFVTIHGFYFKRWLYQGADRSAFLAPLILARSPVYEPPAEADTPRAESDPWVVLGGSAAVAALFAIVFTWYVWRLRPQPSEPPSVKRLRELRGVEGDNPDEAGDAPVWPDDAS